MFNRFSFYFMSCPLLLILFASGVSFAAPTPSAPAREKVRVAQFGKEKFLLYIPFYIAMEEGLFAKRGLDIDLRFAGNDDQIFAAVMSGDAVFGIGDPVFAAISKEKGGPGRVVAMMITKLGLSGYTNKAEVPRIEKPEDLNGLSISSLPAPSTTYTILKQLIDTYHLDTTIVQAGVGAQLATLESGRVDMAVDLEPAVSIAESKGYRVNFSLNMFTDPRVITGITTLDTTVESRPELVQRFVSALQEALRILSRDPDVAMKVGRKLFPTLSEDVIRRSVGRMISSHVFPESVKVPDNLWQRTLRTRLDSGELKKPQATGLVVINSFAEYAEREQ